jgi:hypothetical protein
VRLTAAAFQWDFSPFRYLTPASHATLAWVLGGALVGLGLLLWLVLRHDGDTLWLGGEHGGVLVPTDDVQRPAAGAAARSHPDVVRVEVEIGQRRGALRARARVYARPLADAAVVSAAVDAGVRAKVAQLTGRAPERLDVRVKVLAVGQLARHLP